MYHSVDALRASEHRHTDLTDFNGFHGLIRTLMTQIRRIYTELDRRPVETWHAASLQCAASLQENSLISENVKEN